LLPLLSTAALGAAQEIPADIVPEDGASAPGFDLALEHAITLPGPADTQSSAPAHDLDAGSRRWTVHLDNDLFAFVDRDRDYTGGVAFTLTGERARSHWLSPSRLLDRADRVSGFAAARRGATAEGHALELGLLLFTPQDLAAKEPLHDDRPYANLLYVASSKLALDEPRGAAFQSSLAIGFLGLPFAEQVHRGIHEIVGSAEPRGYDHQISAGGEPTFMYSASRYRLLASGELRGHPYSVRVGAGASIGYITEGNVEIAFRTDAPWWASSAAAADYAGHPQIGGPLPAIRDRPRVQLEAGAKLHARVYNAFLEGQVRRSDVTFSSSKLEPVLLDLWFGAATVLPNGLNVSYTLHRQTEEIKAGRGARDFTWASIGFAQRF
jgi:hypothetical protein